MISKEKVEIARSNWNRASLKLFFKLITPYFADIDGDSYEIFAFLPEYGSINGAIICLTSAPLFETDNVIIRWAKRVEVFYSFVNVEDFQIYNEDYFREMLTDWVKFK